MVHVAEADDGKLIGTRAFIVLFCARTYTNGALMGSTTTVIVRIPTRLKNRLNIPAAATARSRSWVAAHALEVYAEEQEWQVAEIRKGIDDLNAGRIVSHEKVSRGLRSWDKRRTLPPPSCT
jgi:RHH-type transcriptional regulator, rel operon repressor / antitoxin RelB